jgi:DNA-binding MarR family transcriptional regulator
MADNPEHRRASLLLPTEAGIAIQARANARAEAVAAALLPSLDAVQVGQALSLLAEIRAGVEAHQRKAAR